MSHGPLHDLILLSLHGQAVALRDRADTFTERSEVLLVAVERAFTQQMMGEPVDLGELIALAESAAAELNTSHRLGVSQPALSDPPLARPN